MRRHDILVYNAARELTVPNFRFVAWELRYNCGRAQNQHKICIHISSRNLTILHPTFISWSVNPLTYMQVQYLWYIVDLSLGVAEGT